MIEGFNDVCKKGPTAEEPLMGVLVRLVDAKLHEDAIHVGLLRQFLLCVMLSRVQCLEQEQ